ncbi:MAG: aminotransferase class I/II-fold pyridoxal phosphate-dependent enzyme [Acholeplasmataceae bacterium]
MAKIDILKIAKEAQTKKKLNNNLIDATIGMFYNEKNELIIPKVKEAYYNIDLLETFKYGSTDGGKEFEDNVINWVLDVKKDELKEKFLFGGVPTPGGSGALSLIFGSYGNVGDKVLVSNLRWRYDYFIKAANLEIHEFNLFKEDKFDMNDFLNQIDFLSKQQKRIIIVINDPCHNPSGYQLNKDEWHVIINKLNELKNNEFVIAYDIAYFDYDPRGFHEARNTFSYFKHLKENTQVLACFSASKSFAIYGIRLGGLVGLFHNQKQLNFFKKDVLDNALGKWSTAPSVGINIFNMLAGDKESYLEYLTGLTKTLKKRGDIFIKEANEVGLKLFPYKGGFFILIKSDSPEEDFKKLVSKDIYVIPMDVGLRVAICGITIKEVTGLAKRINDIIK